MNKNYDFRNKFRKTNQIVMSKRIGTVDVRKRKNHKQYYNIERRTPRLNFARSTVHVS